MNIFLPCVQFLLTVTLRHNNMCFTRPLILSLSATLFLYILKMCINGLSKICFAVFWFHISVFSEIKLVIS